MQIWDSNGTLAQRWQLTRVVAGSTAVQTQLIQNGTYEIASAVNQDMVLDVDGAYTANGTNVQIWFKNGTAAQKFLVTHVGNDIYTMKNTNSGRYLDSSGGLGQSGDNVRIWDGNAGCAQRWKAVREEGMIVLLSTCNERWALDVSWGLAKTGDNIQVWDRNGTAAQRWVFR